MKNKNEKKKVILMIVGVITLMIVVVGATFAYFNAQIGKGDKTTLNLQAGTTDSLSFNISDIDVTDNDNKVVDENEEDAIIINATQSNFGQNGNSLGDGVNLNAHLIAGNDDNDAHYEYYVYLNISANNLEYTTPESTPELVLVVQDPTNRYINEIEGLEKDEITLGEESVPCFDITKTSGLITIASKYQIDATSETNGIADQNWKVRVIFKNLETDQHLNTDKSFTATLSIQSEKINYLDLDNYDEENYEYTDYRSSNYNTQIKNVSIVNYIAEENELNSVASWDLSSSKDGSIMGWLKANDDPDVPYDLYIGSNLKEGEKIKVKNFEHAFQDLSSVELINLNPSILDTSNLNNTSYMFNMTDNDSSKLITIEGIEELDVSNVINMSYMFSGVDDMITLDLSKWNTHNVTNMSHIFEGMTSLTEIRGIENLDVSNVTNTSYMFAPLNLGWIIYRSVSLTKLDLSSWNVGNVRDMSGMFSGVNLTELNIKGWNTHNVTNMSDMFSGNTGDWDVFYSNINSIIGIEDLDTSSVTNMSRMFSYFGGINSLDLSSWDTHNVTNMSSMFTSTSITTLDISNWNTHKVTNMSYMFGSGSVNGGYDSITNIIGLKSLDVSNVTNMSSMFTRTSITTLDISNWNTHNVTNMSSMFEWAKGLTKLDLSNWDTSNVEYMSYMFAYSGITELDLSNWDTKNGTDMSYMFENSSHLIKIDIRKFTFNKVTNYKYMFYGANSELKVTITGEENKQWLMENPKLKEGQIIML